MAHDLIRGWPELLVVREHRRDQFHEPRVEEAHASFLIPGMPFPEEVHSVSDDKFVIGISSHSLREGRVSAVHDEHDDSSRKDISLDRVVLISPEDLRAHIPFSSFIRVSDDLCSRHSKISNLESEFVRQEDVLRLQISMS